MTSQTVTAWQGFQPVKSKQPHDILNTSHDKTLNPLHGKDFSHQNQKWMV